MWKRIEEYPNYEINEMGDIKQIDSDELMKPQTHTRYKYIGLRKDGKRKYLTIHRLVAQTFLENPNNYDQVDHINRDKFDNRVENLRWCNGSQNCRNKELRKDKSYSQYRGVSWIKKGKWERWTATIRLEGKATHLGYFKKEEEARDAWLKFVDAHNLGEFYTI